MLREMFEIWRRWGKLCFYQDIVPKERELRHTVKDYESQSVQVSKSLAKYKLRATTAEGFCLTVTLDGSWGISDEYRSSAFAIFAVEMTSFSALANRKSIQNRASKTGTATHAAVYEPVFSLLTDWGCLPQVRHRYLTNPSPHRFKAHSNPHISEIRDI
jgi:hypothetical protein